MTVRDRPHALFLLLLCYGLLAHGAVINSSPFSTSSLNGQSPSQQNTPQPTFVADTDPELKARPKRSAPRRRITDPLVLPWFESTTTRLEHHAIRHSMTHDRATDLHRVRRNGVFPPNDPEYPHHPATLIRRYDIVPHATTLYNIYNHGPPGGRDSLLPLPKRNPQKIGKKSSSSTTTTRRHKLTASVLHMVNNDQTTTSAGVDEPVITETDMAPEFSGTENVTAVLPPETDAEPTAVIPASPCTHEEDSYEVPSGAAGYQTKLPAKGLYYPTDTGATATPAAPCDYEQQPEATPCETCFHTTYPTRALHLEPPPAETPVLPEIAKRDIPEPRGSPTIDPQMLEWILWHLTPSPLPPGPTQTLKVHQITSMHPELLSMRPIDWYRRFTLYGPDPHKFTLCLRTKFHATVFYIRPPHFGDDECECVPVTSTPTSTRDASRWGG